MAYKTILLCLNEVKRAPELVAAGLALGKMFGAHISGLFVIPGIQVYPGVGYAALPDVIDSNQAYYRKNETAIRESFEKAMSVNGLSYDFHVVEASIPAIGNDVAAQGRNADLLVVSATDRNAYDGVEIDFVERLVIAAGRPVLILPVAGNIKLDLNDIMIAWDGSREASRAAFDAAPFVTSARKTRLVSVDAHPRGEVRGATIAEALDRHGGKVELIQLSSDGLGTGEALLRAAKDHGSGLLVLGAYGHSRFTEFIFGGATRHVIRNLDRPVLMSH
jgi:nucleotide-binding universal stress UspA family protein